MPCKNGVRLSYLSRDRADASGFGLTAAPFKPKPHRYAIHFGL
jgi:hypothetical protein